MQKNTMALAVVLFIAISLAGCAPAKPRQRLPLNKISYQKTVRPEEKSILIYFAETMPGKPLKKTVWDNSGPFWHPKESTQLGVTQNYRFPPAPDTAKPGRQGTRIVIPFGRYFTAMSHRFPLQPATHRI